MSTHAAPPLRRGLPEWTVASGPFAAAALGPLLPLLIVFAGTLPPSAPHVNRTLALTLAASIALAIATTTAGLAVRGVRRFPRTLRLPLAAFVATQLLALAFAVDPVAGVFGIATTLGGIVVLVASNEVLAQARARRAFLACYFVSGSAAALFAMVLSIMRLPPAMFAYEHGRASGTFLQPNEFAGYLLFLIPLGLAQIGAPRWLRIIGVASAAAGAAGLLLSVSRAALVSLTFALPIFVRRLGKPALWAYVSAAMIGLLIMATAFRNVAHDPSENASRIAIWGGSLRLVQRFALTGVGPFGFHLAYPAFKRPEVNVDELHAHDLPLQILIEDGVLGLAGLTWFVIAAIREAARAGAAIAIGDRERRLLFTALAAGFTASALQNLVDVVTSFLLIVAWPMLGLILSLGREDKGGREEPERRMSASAAAARGAAIALTAALAAAAGACAHGGLRPHATPAATTAAVGPVYRISANGTKGHPVTISNIVNEEPEYTLAAASVIYATNLQKGRFADNTLFFYKGRKLRLTVTAPTAVVDEVTHNVALSGGVHAATAGGVTLSSDAMTYDEKTKELTAVGHVVAVEPGGDMLTGRRAIADLDLQQIQLFAESRP